MKQNKNRIVVKVGTSTLTDESGQNNLYSFDRLAYVLSHIHNSGFEVILVSSGAIAVGLNKLNTQAHTVKMKQAAAAVGQCRIMFLYDKFFGHYGKTVAQILLNSSDIEDNTKRENLTNTFDTLLKNGIIPVVNANDSVDYSEIETSDRLFSDNDMLSAIVAVQCAASKLIILSDIDGLYTADPRTNPDARLIPEITDIDESIFSLAGGAGSRRGTGGMKTKLLAASYAVKNGTDTIITNGKYPEKIGDILRGLPVGTLITQK